MSVVTTTANGPESGGGGGTWGSITGTLADQTDLQSAIDAKAAASGYTASRVLTTSAGGAIAVSTVTTTTLGYLDATSSIQTQLDAKAADSAVVKLTGTQTVAGAKTFSNDVVAGSGTASTTTTTGALQVTGGIGATGAVNHAGTYRCTNTTDSTAFSNGSAVFSGGVGVTKTLFVGTGIGVTTGNVLITSGSLGRDTGVSGSMTDCPTNIYTTNLNVKTTLSWAGNSASAGLYTSVVSATEIALKNGATTLIRNTSTQNDFRVRFELGASTNTVFDWCSGSTTTTNNTATSLWTYDGTGHSNWVWHIDFIGHARRSDSGTEIYYFHRQFGVSMPGGTLTLDRDVVVGTDTTIGGGTLDVDCTFSGNSIRVQAVGETAKTWKWFWTVRFTRGST